ncbi:hypothetical protein FD755_002744 [Muntiacus reevesi]|uniref:Uncharacterized protein n=1 Tax=Muntiacus reevesi TaxID=9886 RepID=A0A5J5N557_MUNRE|nr:hypothetical protein FD755_002744 [Muntiacus reevesi]
MAAVTICSDFGAQENKPTFSLSSFTFIKRLFSSSSLSTIRVVSSEYLSLLIFLPTILIPACASSSLHFTLYTLHMSGSHLFLSHSLCLELFPSIFRRQLLFIFQSSLLHHPFYFLCSSDHKLKSRVQSLGPGDPLEKGMDTHSRMLAWRWIAISFSRNSNRIELISPFLEKNRVRFTTWQAKKEEAERWAEMSLMQYQVKEAYLSPAIMGQITEVLQSNRKFCKKQQMPIQLSVPGTIMGQRGNSVLTSTYSPGTGIRFLTNKHLNVYSVPTSGGALDEAVRGQSSSASENAIGDVYKTRIPNTALSLNSFHAVRYYSKVVPSYDAAAVTNQNTPVHFPTAVPKVSKFLPQHCNSVLGQACTAHPNCLQQFWAY